MRLYLNRFFRAARLDVELYQEIVANPGMLNQAWITVLIYCMAASWGSFGGIGVVCCIIPGFRGCQTVKRKREAWRLDL